MIDKKIMDYDFLTYSENRTLKKTEEIYKTWSNNMRESLNVLLAIPYYIGKCSSSNKNELNYHSIAHHHYIRVPYAFKSIFSLIKTGYYLESSILLRSILEIFVQLRYFNKHKELFVDYSIKKIKVQFKKMFDEISIGLYEKTYKMLSDFSHGGIGAINFRVKYKTKDYGHIIQGSNFDMDSALFVINQQLQLSYGFLNYATIFFPELLNKLPTEFNEKRNFFLNWIDKMNEDSIYLNPETKKYYDVIYPLIK